MGQQREVALQPSTDAQLGSHAIQNGDDFGVTREQQWKTDEHCAREGEDLVSR